MNKKTSVPIDKELAYKARRKLIIDKEGDKATIAEAVEQAIKLYIA